MSSTRDRFSLASCALLLLLVAGCPADPPKVATAPPADEPEGAEEPEVADEPQGADDPEEPVPQYLVEALQKTRRTLRRPGLESGHRFDEWRIEAWEGNPNAFVWIEPATLSAEEAAQLATFKGRYLHVELDPLSTDVARALASWLGWGLELNATEELTPDTAAELSTWRGWRLHLNGVSALTPETAAALAAWPGRELSLDGVASLSSATAEELAKWPGRRLSLLGLTSLTPEAAEKLAAWRGSELLLGLETLNTATATALAERETLLHGSVLALPRLKEIDSKAAAALGAWKGVSLDLSGLRALTPEAARGLVRPRSELVLTGLSSLDVETAEALGFFGGDLVLGAALSPDVLETLLSSKAGGSLDLSRLAVIQPTTAELFVSQEKYPNLSGLRSITPELAQKLAQPSVEVLYLNGLESLDVESAKELAKLYRSRLELDGLRELDAELAATLATSKVDSLSLDGVTKLDPEVAAVLASWGGETLSLNGLKALDATTVEALLASECKTLALNGLNRLPTGVPELLSAWKGEALSLEGVRTLSVAAAEHLAHWEGRYLFLSGLTSLDPEAAAALAAWKGSKLNLNGLTVLTPALARGLLAFGRELELNGVTTLDAATAEVLAASSPWDLWLAGLVHLTPGAAKALASWKNDGWSSSDGVLWLEGLTTLQPDAARALRTWSGDWLGLGGVTTFDHETANALGPYFYVHDLGLAPQVQNVWYLAPNGWTELDAQGAAKVLTREDSVLALNSLRQLTPEVAQILSGFRGKRVNLDSLAQLDEPTAKALAALRAETLSLTSLTKLDPGAVKHLTSIRGLNELLLDVTELDAESAQALAAFKGSRLQLGLTSLDAAAAKELVAYQGDLLWLNDLVDLDAATAEQLGQWTIRYMDLSGLKALSTEAAQGLANYRGKTREGEDWPQEGMTTPPSSSLNLDGLQSLAPETARLLATSKAQKLSLNGLVNPGPAIVRELTEYPGVLLLGGLELESIDLELARSIGALRCRTLSLSYKGAAARAGRLPEDVRKELFFYTLRGTLFPPGLRHACSEARWRSLDLKLAKRVIDTLNSRSDHEEGGGLNLAGLGQLAPDVAVELAKCPLDELYLTGLEALSTEAAQALRAYKGVLMLSRAAAEVFEGLPEDPTGQ